MHDDGIEPDQFTYTTILRSCLLDELPPPEAKHRAITTLLKMEKMVQEHADDARFSKRFLLLPLHVTLVIRACGRDSDLQLAGQIYHEYCSYFGKQADDKAGTSGALIPVKAREDKFETIRGFIHEALMIPGLTKADRARVYELSLQTNCFDHWDENLNHDPAEHRVGGTDGVLGRDHPTIGLNLHGFSVPMAVEAVDRVLKHIRKPDFALPNEHVHGGTRQRHNSRQLPDLPILTGFRGPEYHMRQKSSAGGPSVGDDGGLFTWSFILSCECARLTCLVC